MPLNKLFQSQFSQKQQKTSLSLSYPFASDAMERGRESTELNAVRACMTVCSHSVVVVVWPASGRRNSLSLFQEERKTSRASFTAAHSISEHQSRLFLSPHDVLQQLSHNSSQLFLIHCPWATTRSHAQSQTFRLTQSIQLRADQSPSSKQIDRISSSVN